MSLVCQGKVIIEKEDRKIIDCLKCGYKHVVPMYSEKELEDFYEKTYPTSTPSHLWAEKVYNVTKLTKNNQRKILDLGCWQGKQLEFFKNAGWICTGVELNKKAASIASSKGIKVFQISINRFFEKFSKKKWDVINAAYILEHIPNPKGFLIKIKKHLKKHGILILEVPNEFNFFQKAYLKMFNLQPYWIALPDHLNYFDKKGINNLLKKTKWKIIHGESSFPMEMFLLMGDNYLKNRQIGKNKFKKVVKMEKTLRNYNISSVSKMYSLFYKNGIGRSMTLYAKSVK